MNTRVQQKRGAQDYKFKKSSEKKLSKNERIKNGSNNHVNVCLTMPGKRKRPAISDDRLRSLSDREAINNGVSAQQCKANLATDTD